MVAVVELFINIDFFIFLLLDYFEGVFVLVSGGILSLEMLTGLAMACLLIEVLIDQVINFWPLLPREAHILLG